MIYFSFEFFSYVNPSYFPLIIYHCWKFTRKTFPKDDEKKLVYFLIQCECTGSDCGIHVVTLSHLTDNSNLLWKRLSFVGIHSPYLGTVALWDEKRESRKSRRQQSRRLIFQFSWKFQADRMEFWENPNLVKFNVKSVKAIYYKNVWKYWKMKNVGRSFNSERIQKHCDIIFFVNEVNVISSFCFHLVRSCEICVRKLVLSGLESFWITGKFPGPKKYLDQKLAKYLKYQIIIPNKNLI